MGMFTGYPRSANIVAETKAAGFTIPKAELITSLNANKDMLIKLLQNLVSLLSERLTTANLRLEEQAQGGEDVGDEDEYDDELGDEEYEGEDEYDEEDDE